MLASARLRTSFCVAAMRFAAVLLVAHAFAAAPAAADDIPNLVGTWVGENRTVSDKKGYKIWGEKTVEITEQQDRRFRGHFTYPAGTRSSSVSSIRTTPHSLGSPPTAKATTTAASSGPTVSPPAMWSSGEDATAGCAELTRRKKP